MASIREQLENFFDSAYDKSVDELLEMANMVLENQGFFSAIGGTLAPITWADEAQQILEIYHPDLGGKVTGIGGHAVHGDSEGNFYAVPAEDWNNAVFYTNALNKKGKREESRTYLDNLLQSGTPYDEFVFNYAASWLSGDIQPYKQNRFLSKTDEHYNEFLEDLTNAQENVANTTDFSGVSEAEANEILESETYQFHNEKLQELQSFFTDNATMLEAVGIEEPGFTLQRDANGNYVGSFYEGQEPAETETETETETEDTTRSTLIKDNGDGTFDIYYSDTGEVIETYEGTEAQALARQQQLMGMGTPTVSGRPDLYVIEPLESETVEPYVEDGVTITPTTATTEQLEQLQEGTLESFDQTYGTETASGNASWEETYETLSDMVDQAEEQAAETGFEVTEEQRAQLLEDALAELKEDDYYKQTIRLAELDVGTELERLVEDLATEISGLERQYETDVEEKQESLRERGLLYGGVRSKEEQRLVNEYNAALESAGLGLTRGIEDTTEEFEEAYGSEAAEELASELGTTTGVGRFIAGEPTYEAGEEIDLLQPVGEIYGTKERELEMEAEVLAQEREDALRDLAVESL